MLTQAYNVGMDQAAERAPTWVAALEEMDGPAAASVIARYLRGDGPPVFMPTAIEFAQEVREVERAERERERLERPRATLDRYDCNTCIDQGLVSIGTHRYVWMKPGAEPRSLEGADLMAPCPDCSRGRTIEFPLEGVGPWGPDGFWRGRGHTVISQGLVEVG